MGKISAPKQSTKNHMTVSPAHPIEMSKMDAKFESALKSVNFTDDCMAHPIVEQYLRWLFYILLNWSLSVGETHNVKHAGD